MKVSKVYMLSQDDLFFQEAEEKALAGTQTAFIELSRAFADMGLQVCVYSNTSKSFASDKYSWSNLRELKRGDTCDLLVVNVSPSLFTDFDFVKASTKLLWIHNTANYLLSWKRYKHILRHLPVIVFSGQYHLSTLPFFLPSGGRRIIPYGLSREIDQVLSTTEQKGGLDVYFTSNPLRSLRWVVDLWVKHIHPSVPDARLNVFSSWKTYGKWGDSLRGKMESELMYAASFSSSNIIMREVLPKQELFREMRRGRMMLYRGDKAETFCLAVAEAQALGLPAVVCDIGSMRERVEDGGTGYVVNDEEAFVRSALEILRDDNLWGRMAVSAIARSKQYDWSNAAKEFLKIVSGR